MMSTVRERLLALIGMGELSGGAIALRLGVSISTVARALTALKREGFDIVSLRRGMQWYYELRGSKEGTERVAGGVDSFLKLRGFVKSREGDWSERHDEYLYGMVKDHPAKYRRKRRAGKRS